MSLLVYPQLASGTVCQWPVEKLAIERVPELISPGGRRFAFTDADARRIEWQLRYDWLNEAEAAGLEDFFSATRGELRSFLFLDPTDNLLSHSENQGNPAWNRGALLAHEAAVADPDGGWRAARLTNTGGSVDGISQSVSGPGWFQYAASIWVRAEAETPAELFLESGGERAQVWETASSEWRSLSLSARLTSGEAAVRFGVRVPGGAALEVYGAQLEAQPQPSGYKRNESGNGVYANTRFSQAELRVTEIADGRLATVVKLAAAVNK